MKIDKQGGVGTKMDTSWGSKKCEGTILLRGKLFLFLKLWKVKPYPATESYTEV